jgi:dienelactone hydrolase
MRLPRRRLLHLAARAAAPENQRMPVPRPKTTGMLRKRHATIGPVLRVLCCALCIVLAGLATSASAYAQLKPNPGGMADPSHPGLLEQAVMLSISSPTGPYRLEAIIVRPAQAQGRLPVVLLTHGKPRLPADMALIRAELLAREARDLAYRGYLAVGVIRRGYGRSGGTPGVATNAPYAKCNVSDLQKYFEIESDDLAAALRVITQRPDADANRVIVIGGSVGGGASLGLVARKTAGVIAAVNIAGGVRLTNAQGEVICPSETLISAVGRLGAGSKTPTLWIYSENDSVFSPDVARRAHAAYVATGGVAELRIVPPIPPDGHHAFELPNGRVHWLAALDMFLRAQNLPTWQPSQVEAVMRAAKVPAGNREMINKYFSLYTPKVLLQAGDGRVTYTAETRSLTNARNEGLSTCQNWAKGPCRVIMENFSLTSP